MRVTGIAPRTWQTALGAFLLLTGMLSVAQWRAERPLRAQTELPTRRTQELAVLLKREEEARQALEGEVQRLRARVAGYQEAVLQGRGAAEAMARETAHVRLILGLEVVAGPGVVVRLRSGGAPGGVVPVQTRAEDLSGLVNELWAAGAEAVAVNGVRILGTTGFRQREQAVIAGVFPLTPPFVIQAIGEPLTLESALALRGGFVEGLRSIGLGVTVERRSRLILPAYRGPMQFRNARPTGQP